MSTQPQPRPARPSALAAPLVLGLALLQGPLAAPGAARAADAGLPLVAARSLSFEVDSGTWMSLDVAPDGGTLLFDLLGDIYRLPIGGGPAQPLLTGMAFESQPVHSPDGRHFAFVSDRGGNENLWLAAADGTQLRALTALEDNTEFSSPAWSADGSAVFATRLRPDTGVAELWLHKITTGEARRIAPEEHGAGVAKEQRANALGAAASPDGRHVYYASRRGFFVTDRPFAPWTIMRRDLADGTEQVVVTAAGGAVRPALSPDGRQLVYLARRDGESTLRLRDLDSGADRELAAPAQRDQQDAWAAMDLAPRHSFTPDGREVLFSTGEGLRAVEVATGMVRDVPFTAAVALEIGPELRREIPPDEGPVTARLVQAPAPSPDGRQVAFSAFAQVHVMDLDEGVARPLGGADMPGFQPAWAPDGRSLAYVSWSAREGGHVWRAALDGSAPVRLTREAAYYSDPAFSPDGSAVLALRSSHHERLRRPMEYGPFRQADVVRLPAAGGTATRLAAGMFGGPPQFTGDPARWFIYGPEGLVSFDNDGKDRRLHFAVVGPGYYFEEQAAPVKALRISPDGRHALAQIRSQLYLVRVPPDSAGQPVDVARPATAHRQLTTVGADFMAWADDGRTITWAVGATFYRRALASVEFDAPAETNASIAAAAQAVPMVVTRARDRPQGALLLRGATVITMRGDEVIENADLLVVDGRIAAVGARGTVAAPAGAAVRELAGRYIVPGFVDAHAHWAEIRREILDLESYTFLANLAFGVTAGLDVSTLTIDMLAYQDLIDAGLVLGPRGFSTGPAVFSFNNFRSLQHARDVLTRYRDHYRVANLKQYRAGNRRQRQWVAAAAHELGLVPTTEGADNLKLSLTQVLDGFAGVEHALPVVGLGEDVVTLLGRTRTSLTPTLVISDWGPGIGRFIAGTPLHETPRIRRFFPPEVILDKTGRVTVLRDDQYRYLGQARDIARIHAAGGLVGAGSHSEFQGIGLHWEMQALAAGGLSPHEVLKIATLGSSEAIGRKAQLGSLEAGKYADLVVLGADPLEDIANTLALELVMKNGRLYDAGSLDELWPRQRPLPPLWFHDD